MNSSNIVSVTIGSKEFKIENILINDSIPIYESGRRTAWKEHLLDCLSNYCGCALMIERNKDSKTIKYSLVGRRYNIAQMRGAWNWLIKLIQKHSKESASGNGRIVINSYCLGFVDGLKEMVELSPRTKKMNQDIIEAKHYMHLTHYELPIISESNNSNIDNYFFTMGKLRGLMINLDDVIKPNDD